ncbi:MAG: hypothetical protein QXE81_01915 [Desulfurococcaceae archaeon]
MLRKINLFILVYISMVSALNLSMFLLGENRIDAYIATNILVYFVSFTVIRPVNRSERAINALNAFLIILFIGIAILRAYEAIIQR